MTYGHGMDTFIRDESELGYRVAYALDVENNVWGAADTYWWLTVGDLYAEND